MACPKRFTKEEIREHQKETVRAKRRAIFDLLGWKCARCGFSDIRALQIDHIHGGGGADRRNKSPHSYYNKVLRIGSESYQILCANCNWIKRYE